MLVVRIAWCNCQRWTLKINIDSVEPILIDNPSDGGNKVGHAFRVCEREVLSASTERDQVLLALAFKVGDVIFELKRVQARRRLKLHRPLRCVVVWG